MKKLTIFIFFLLINLTGCSFIQEKYSTNKTINKIIKEKSTFKYHIVKYKETLSSIANIYLIDKEKIIYLNKLTIPYKLFIGQKLLIKDKRKNMEKCLYKKIDKDFLPPFPNKDFLVTNNDVEVHKSSDSDNNKYEKISDIEIDKMIKFKDGLREIDNGAYYSSGNKQSDNLIWPTNGKIISDFSAFEKNSKNKNNGINISAPIGSKVKASQDGVIARCGNQLRGFGNFILIKHHFGLMTIYTHLDKILVEDGQRVKKGFTIGTVGMSGKVSQPQLHFEVRKGKNPIDPKSLLQ